MTTAHRRRDPTASDPPPDPFAEHRRHVFGVAYRMLGRVAEADDVVQEVWLRWSAAPRDDVRQPAAWLTTVTTRLCLDRLRSSVTRREAYVGPWLPEPLVSDDADPAVAAELSDSLTTAFLLLLERLNPLERAVFLLHDVFGYGFGEIAGIVERPAASCRQVASRARAKVAPDRHAPHRARAEDEQRLAAAFARAAIEGDLDMLLTVLTDDVVLWSDGGADRHAARQPVIGSTRVARYVANLAQRLPSDGWVTPARINGDPGFVAATADGPWLALSLELAPEGIRRIYFVVNPDKLRHLGSGPRDLGGGAPR
jgi:RNA polymerase sigma-70 factor, ECF subfamily